MMDVEGIEGEYSWVAILMNLSALCLAYIEFSLCFEILEILFLEHSHPAYSFECRFAGLNYQVENLSKWRRAEGLSQILVFGHFEYLNLLSASAIPVSNAPRLVSLGACATCSLRG